MIDIVRKEEWLHPDRFPLAIKRQEPQRRCTMHAHDFCEIVLVTAGRGTHRTERDGWTLVAGDAFVIGGMQQHEYLNTDDLCLINILYDPKALRMDQWDLASLPGYHALFTLEPHWRRRHQFRSRLHLPARDLAAAETYVDRMDDELARREPGFEFMVVATLMQLVGFLSRRYGQSANPDSQALLRIAEAITFLERHCDQPVNLDKLATMARMSERSFLREFKKAMGTSPIDYLIQIRVTRAAEQLRQSDAAITQIAFDLGFEDSNYFSRQFRKVMGVSPRQYRGQLARDL
jgi:AraC family L-rhamnose operon transcriptional activator RhaR/AraC family L-rhamnose operon regulatory protein RhaS